MVQRFQKFATYFQESCNLFLFLASNIIGRIVSPRIIEEKGLYMSRTKELSDRIDAAYSEGNIEESLKIATELVAMKVKSKIGDFNDYDQEEVVQACVIAAFDGKFKGENKDKKAATFSTWLYGIADNQIHSAIRARQRERSKQPDDRVRCIRNYAVRSDRERELAFQVASLIEQGLTYKEMSRELNASHALTKKTNHVSLRKRVSRWTAMVA